MDIKIGVIGAQGRLGKRIGALHPITEINRSTPRQNLPCDILIDVSSPEALQENLSANKPMVIGTTGQIQFALIEQAAKQLPLFYAPNFSIGVTLLRKLASLAYPFSKEIEITETHHTEKKDSPSGTALLLAQILPEAKIHSIRKEGAIGEHTITFKAFEETITITHTAHSRDTFARGAIAAAYFLLGKPPGLYNMDDLLYS